jgi:hypothetical protein
MVRKGEGRCAHWRSVAVHLAGGATALGVSIDILHNSGKDPLLDVEEQVRYRGGYRESGPNCPHLRT